MFLSEPRFVTVDGEQFAYREAGDPAGAPVVMLHGWPESSYCWERVAARLRNGLRIIAPDLRGLGDSTRDGEQAAFLKQALGADMLRVLDALGVDRFQLVSHDWGGVVAQEMAIAAPERITRLAIMNISLVNNARGNAEALEVIRNKGARHQWYQHFQQQKGLAEAMIPGNEAEWLGVFLRTANDEPFPEDAFREYVRCYSIPDTPRTGACYYRTMPEDQKRWASLAGHVFPMPGLYVHGNRDRVVIPEFLNHIEDCFREVRVESVAAGHFLQEEMPDTVAGHLNDFLTSS